jgi:hypothetical protein
MGLDGIWRVDGQQETESGFENQHAPGIIIGTSEVLDFRRHYEALILERIAKDWLKREPQWTQSLAVGDPEFVTQMQPLIRHRQETIVEPGEHACWVLKEEPTSQF